MASDSSRQTQYGWVIVAVGIVSIALHASIGYASSVFLVPIADDMGWSRGAVSAGMSLYSLGSGLWLPVVGYLVQAWGPRRELSLAGLFLVGGLLVLSRVQSPLAFSLIMLLPVSLGSVGLGGLANFAAIQRWFVKQRGTAFALAAIGSSIGVLVVPAVQQIILDLGWRSTYQFMAAAILVLAVVHLLAQREPPPAQSLELSSDVRPDPTLGVSDIFCKRDFWYVFVGLGMSYFFENLVVVHHVAYLTDHGFSSSDVVTVLEIVGLAGLLGRIVLGWLSDRIGTTHVFAIVTAFLAVGAGFLVLAGERQSPAYLYLFGLFFGSCLGTSAILYNRLTADSYGSHNFGRFMGLAGVGGSVGVAAGSAFGGAAFDATGSYLGAFAAGIVALIVSFICLRSADAIAQEVEIP